MKKLTAVAMVLMSAIFVGCPSVNHNTAHPPVVTDQNKCGSACAHIGPQGLNCEEGKPIDMKKPCVNTAGCSSGQTCEVGTCTTSCEQFCIATENQGVWLDPTCVATITSCDQIDSCPLPAAKLSHVERPAA